MNLLLDTHIFIWWENDYKRLSHRQSEAIQNPDTVVWLSLVSIWEMQIKTQLGRITFDEALSDKIARQRQENDLQILHLNETDIYALSHLPHYHRDPFGRLLIAQALHNQMTLVTHDDEILAYDVETLT
jgi:PIN domain nuclease of toxin-antitoxin system